MRNRQEEIRSQGLVMHAAPRDYGKIKIQNKTIEDAVLRAGNFSRFTPKGYGYTREDVYSAMATRDKPKLRAISNYFYDTSGIYQKVCDYFAYMYRFDWYVVPEILDESVKEEKVLKDLNNLLNFLDNSRIKMQCGKMALRAIVDGVYYGYLVKSSNGIVIQDLPANYCRCIYNSGAVPAVQFNMRYFDDMFRDSNYRLKVLKMFPEEFRKGYILYKQHKLEQDDINASLGYDGILGRERWGDIRLSEDGWYQLEVGSAIRFAINENECPILVRAIPSIMDLDGSVGIDKQKQMQQLQKLLIQQLPLDKNFDLVFDLEEAKDIHENAIEMVGNTVGLDVLTTFTDVEVEDMSDSSASQSNNTLERMTKLVYDNMGVASNLFNSTNSLALERSILNDESSIRNLLYQFVVFYDTVTQSIGANKRKYAFRFYMLETTQYNYKELSKMYKEHVQIGYSKMLPQIALGHSQSSIIHTAHFENEVLHLSEIMIPPLMSSTMNAEALAQVKTGGKTTNENGNTGRPEKADNEKSEKTVANQESQ